AEVAREGAPPAATRSVAPTSPPAAPAPPSAAQAPSPAAPAPQPALPAPGLRISDSRSGEKDAAAPSSDARPNAPSAPAQPAPPLPPRETSRRRVPVERESSVAKRAEPRGDVAARDAMKELGGTTAGQTASSLADAASAGKEQSSASTGSGGAVA